MTHCSVCETINLVGKRRWRTCFDKNNERAGLLAVNGEIRSFCAVLTNTHVSDISIYNWVVIVCVLRHRVELSAVSVGSENSAC